MPLELRYDRHHLNATTLSLPLSTELSVARGFSNLFFQLFSYFLKLQLDPLSLVLFPLRTQAFFKLCFHFPTPNITNLFSLLLHRLD